MKNLILNFEETEESLCKGLFFRCHINKFWNDKRNCIEFRESYQLLKRKSCPGCSVCMGFQEDIRNALVEETIVPPKTPLDGEIYCLILDIISFDAETGYADDWEWVLTPFVTVRDLFSTGSFASYQPDEGEMFSPVNLGLGEKENKK